MLSNVEVFTIFWGGDKVPYLEEINLFYSEITNSSWQSTLSEYNTRTQVIGPGKLIGNYSYVKDERGHLVTKQQNINDAQIRVALSAMFESNQIPAPTVNTYYVCTAF